MPMTLPLKTTTLLSSPSDLVREAAALYEAYDLDRLPAALQRNSLDYYYLSIYPSLSRDAAVGRV